jgi:hypothetical protein
MNETNESGTNPAVVHASADVASGPSREQIAELAYLIWMSEGCPEGRDKSNWQEAEEELRSQYPASIDTLHEPSGENQQLANQSKQL